ncbi:hypothetical protein POM88_034368 [Heracleum sosnowskyi]|uniref:Uncharacterized protein n=1 Tax=Heracleum sosnowskyi TaxID=360622 RepID=A0AAD8HKE9_9APIA|nr:hypothetical protein POM88_034368 [Heracleum sosnowskyi]
MSILLFHPGNILNIQNNASIEGACDSTATSAIEEFVEVFDDSFSRTTNLWNPKVVDPKFKPYSGQRFNDIESCFQFYIEYGLQGSHSDVGLTVVDFQNWMRDIKLYIGKHDVDMLLQKFNNKHETSNGGFVLRVSDRFRRSPNSSFLG